MAASPETGWMSINESGLMRGAFHRGDLSPRAEEAVAGHYVVLSIRVPPVVRAGDQVEVYLDHQYSTGNGWVRYEVTPKSQELRPFRFATRLKDRQPEFFMGVLRLQPGPHSIDFECRRMIAAKSTEKETDTTDYRVVRSDAQCHVDVYAGSEFDDAMRVALQSVVELPAWAEYSPKNYDVLMNFSRPCPLDGELIIDVRDGDQRRSLGSIPIRCGRALSLSARSADKCFSTGDTLQMWCRFLPASATLNSAGKPFSPVEWGPFSVKRVRSLRVSQVLRLEPTRK
ncbi:MAG: hypothetical protein SF069_12485 [Phycisphaerae bacterium]|nr:hypothetical protein [Phycisphaerae bacterium]